MASRESASAADDFRHAARHAVGEHDLAVGDGDLRGRGVGVGQRAHHLVELEGQARNAGDELVGRVGQVEHLFLGRVDGLGGVGHRLPGFGDLLERAGDATRVGVAFVTRHALGGRPGAQRGDDLVDAGLGRLELGEGVGVAVDGLLGVLGQLLREHLQVGGEASCTVLLVVQVAGVDEVGTEHTQRNDQDDGPESNAEIGELVGDRARVSAHD